MKCQQSLNKSARDKELDQQVELSRLEKENQSIVIDALKHANENNIQALLQISQSADELKNSLLSRLKAEDQLQLTSGHQSNQQSLSVTGKVAREVTTKPRETATQKIVSGNYQILSAGFHDLNNVSLELAGTDGEVLKVTVPDGVLNYQQAEALKNNAWNRSPVLMQLLVHDLRGKLTRPSLISINDQMLETD